MTMRKFPRTALLALCMMLALPATRPAWADADGSPHLDPTNGAPGTDYLFVMPEVSRTMDPLTASSQKVWRGTFTLLQGAGQAGFEIVDMEIDLNNDGVTDRTLRCSGRNGFNRFGFECSEDDGGDDFNLLITGRAVRFFDGTLSLRKATGHGFTETHTLLVSFAAISR